MSQEIKETLDLLNEQQQQQETQLDSFDLNISDINEMPFLYDPLSNTHDLTLANSDGKSKSSNNSLEETPHCTIKRTSAESIEQTNEWHANQRQGYLTEEQDFYEMSYESNERQLFEKEIQSQKDFNLNNKQPLLSSTARFLNETDTIDNLTNRQNTFSSEMLVNEDTPEKFGRDKIVVIVDCESRDKSNQETLVENFNMNGSLEISKTNLE